MGAIALILWNLECSWLYNSKNLKHLSIKTLATQVPQSGINGKHKEMLILMYMNVCFRFQNVISIRNMKSTFCLPENMTLILVLMKK